ncbi:MAG: CPBP family intramembrane glutamic endopeptidase [Cyclobacteriaceae bacterium]
MKTIQVSESRLVSRTKTLVIFVFTIILGVILFVAPNLFFGITKFNGGLTGINLLIMGLFQCITVCSLIHFSLRLLKKDFRYIGFSLSHWKRDGLLGLVGGLTWVTLQFVLIIPNTGGADREDISQMVEMMDGSLIGMLSYIALGVIGGGITEEIYSRGYFITVLPDTFKNPKVGMYIATILSILFFAALHLPSDSLGWFDILVPTFMYTFLFLYTKRLVAPIVAHGIYNMTAIMLTYYTYYA